MEVVTSLGALEAQIVEEYVHARTKALRLTVHAGFSVAVKVRQSECGKELMCVYIWASKKENLREGEKQAIYWQVPYSE